jgi:hypothetical protein
MSRALLPVLVTTLIASHALTGQTARFDIAPDSVLVDERFRVALDGLKPGQDVTIRVDGDGGLSQSSAMFRSDDRGRVDVADPMRLIWSATGNRPLGGPGPAAQPWTFTAETDGRVLATRTIVRRAIPEAVRVVPLRERGLVGVTYHPPGPGPHPAMIVLPGSEGGIPGSRAHAGGLASSGYLVLALAYFNAEGLPPLLQNIPLDYWWHAGRTGPSQRGVVGQTADVPRHLPAEASVNRLVRYDTSDFARAVGAPTTDGESPICPNLKPSSLQCSRRSQPQRPPPSGRRVGADRYANVGSDPPHLRRASQRVREDVARHALLLRRAGQGLLCDVF